MVVDSSVYGSHMSHFLLPLDGTGRCLVYRAFICKVSLCVHQMESSYTDAVGDPSCSYSSNLLFCYVAIAIQLHALQNELDFPSKQSVTPQSRTTFYPMRRPIDNFLNMSALKTRNFAFFVCHRPPGGVFRWRLFFNLEKGIR